MDKPFRRNPQDISEALGMTPEAREPLRDALSAAQRFHNIKAHQAADETAIYTAIARLMDAGVLVRGGKDSHMTEDPGPLFLPDIPGANQLQNARLNTINEQHTVERWEVRGATLWTVVADGDEAEIHSDGTVTWRSA